MLGMLGDSLSEARIRCRWALSYLRNVETDIPLSSGRAWIMLRRETRNWAVQWIDLAGRTRTQTVVSKEIGERLVQAIKAHSVRQCPLCEV
jgi:hypothetical protein